MSCEDIRNLGLLVAFGEGTPADETAVREHAARCPACAAELRALREGMDLLAHAPREAPSQDAQAAIGGLLLREAPRPRRSGAWMRVAAAVLVVAGGAWAWKATRPAPEAKKEPIAHAQPEKPAKKTLPPVDPELEWNHLDDELGYAEDTLGSLSPSTASDEDADATEDPLSDISERLETLSASIEKL